MEVTMNMNPFSPEVTMNLTMIATKTTNLNPFSLSHLSDPALLGELAALLAQDRATTASLLAHLGEVDARKLYLPAACPSMFDYCLRELHLSEGSAFKRSRAARHARRFPAVPAALAVG